MLKLENNNELSNLDASCISGVGLAEHFRWIFEAEHLLSSNPGVGFPSASLQRIKV